MTMVDRDKLRKASGQGVETEGSQLLPDWAMGRYKKWDKADYGIGDAPDPYSSGGGGGPVGGNVAGYKDFEFEEVDYSPYGGEDIELGDVGYQTFGEDFQYTPFEEQATYDPFTGEYASERFEQETDPFRGEKFAAPTYQEAMADPGYQFRVAQGQQALENAAAAKGMLRTGGTMKGLLDYNQAMASQEYDKTYGRRLGEYQMGYGQDMSADREQWAREAQKFGMNRQAALDQYDREFARQQANQAGAMRAYDARFRAQQANEAGRLGAYGARAGTHQMDQSGLFQAAQSNRAAELAARESNLGKYGINLGAQQSAWDRNYQGGRDVYQFGLAKAQAADAAAESAASRAAAGARGDAANRQRAYDQAYDRAMNDYLMGYQQDVYRDETRWGRLGELQNTPYTEPPPG
jgi:hypothetical protein